MSFCSLKKNGVNLEKCFQTTAGQNEIFFFFLLFHLKVGNKVTRTQGVREYDKNYYSEVRTLKEQELRQQASYKRIGCDALFFWHFIKVVG